ncbi:unnamed protein product [Linum tenue]|uniref:2-oxoglutarate-dependent dioxygenase DAO n=3 Tax=Linum tenue TaxID=586396 RepID=A0AAV0JY38_9ROSI|nr:unnamed protein product [Linum tenue]
MVVPAAANGGDQKPYEIPFFDLGAAGEEEIIADVARWKEMCDKVREACEIQGCFCFTTEKVPAKLREEMAEGLRQLFDLPVETKERHVSPKPYRSYLGKNDVVPYLESFGIDDQAPDADDAAEAFTAVMWPQGNPEFRESLSEMSAKMLDLNLLIIKMLLTSYNLDDAPSHAADTTTSYFRLMKYKVPPAPPAADHYAGIGLMAHTDKNTVTILGQNDVQGLEIQPKEDNNTWVPVVIPEGAFVAIVGDALKAWSNGRLHSVRHRVVLRGEKERYSWGSFLMPKDGSRVQAPEEFVDKDHPPLYRGFTYADFLSYFVSTLKDDALDVFAGLPDVVDDRDQLAVN